LAKAARAMGSIAPVARSDKPPRRRDKKRRVKSYLQLRGAGEVKEGGQQDEMKEEDDDAEECGASTRVGHHGQRRDFGGAAAGEEGEAARALAPPPTAPVTEAQAPVDDMQCLLCPISGVPMDDPVIAADGHTYQRAAIEEWIARKQNGEGGASPP
jgi:hypothetical protein